MKLAEAIALIGELRDEANLTKQADIQLYRKEEVLDAPTFTEGMEKYVRVTSQILWYKAQVGMANATTYVAVNDTKYTLNVLRLHIDTMREHLAMAKSYYTTARTQPVREDYEYSLGMERVKTTKVLNGVTAEGLKAVVDKIKRELKAAEAALARANWETEIQEYPE